MVKYLKMAISSTLFYTFQPQLVKEGTSTDCSLDRKSFIWSVFGSLLMVGLMEMSPIKWKEFFQRYFGKDLACKWVRLLLLVASKEKAGDLLHRYLSFYLACKWVRLPYKKTKMVSYVKEKLLHRYFSFYPASGLYVCGSQLMVGLKIVPRKKIKMVIFFTDIWHPARMYVGHYWWLPWWKMSPYCDNTACPTQTNWL